MCLKNQILASKLSQTQLNNLVSGARLYLKGVGSVKPIHELFFSTYFPKSNSNHDFRPHDVMGYQSLYISVLIHLSVLSVGYGIEVSRHISLQAHKLGMSVNELKATESKVFADLISRYMSGEQEENELSSTFTDAVSTLWESDEEMVTTFKSNRH